MDRKNKTALYKEKRDQIIAAFKDNDWQPNKAYLNKLRSSYYAKTIDFNEVLETGIYGNDRCFLISSCGEFAVSIMKRVIHIHMRSRQFAKVLNLDMLETEITEIGLRQGLIQLYWNNYVIKK